MGNWAWGIGNWELAVRSLEVSSRCVVGNLLPNERRTDPKGRRKTHRGIGNRQEGTSPHPFTPSPLHLPCSPAPLPPCPSTPLLRLEDAEKHAVAGNF